MSREFLYGFTSVNLSPDHRRRMKYVKTMDVDVFAGLVLAGQLVFMLAVMGCLAAAFGLMFFGMPDIVVAIPCLAAVAVTLVQWRLDYTFFP